MNIREQIAAYAPCNEQEARDKTVILDFLAKNGDAFLRENPLAHMTAWTGGHADGEEDLLAVALREVREETGVRHVVPASEEICSLEILTVDGHEKRGAYVPSHLHLNVTYLLEADERDALCVCEAENSGVRWFSLDEALKASTEPWFVERIYKKLNEKLR